MSLVGIHPWEPEAGSPAPVRAPTGQVPGPWGSSIDDSHREHSTKVSPVILNENRNGFRG